MTTSYLPCKPGCAGSTYEGCDERLIAGQTCQPTKISDSPCISGVAPELKCPNLNLDDRIPTFIPAIPHEDTPMVQCRVCGLVEGEQDYDGVQGYFTGNLVSFGPNQMHGELNEDHILGYNVYFVNPQHEKLSNVVAILPKMEDDMSTASESCCVADTYTVFVSALEIPYLLVEEPSDLRIMVVPVDENFVEMPVGLTQEMHADAAWYCPSPLTFLEEEEVPTCSTQRADVKTERRLLPSGTKIPGGTKAKRFPGRSARRLSSMNDTFPDDFCFFCTGMPAYCDPMPEMGVLMPGETCQTFIPQSSCFSGNAPGLTCPADQTGWGPALSSIHYFQNEFPEIQCQVCGIGSVAEDSDERAGYYSGVVSFGRNMKGGQIDESEIDHYKVYITSSTGDIDYDLPPFTGEAVAEVPVSGSGDSTCCDEAAYSVYLDGVRFTVGLSHIMVVPVHASGGMLYEMPVGKLMEFSDSDGDCVEPVDMLAAPWRPRLRLPAPSLRRWTTCPRVLCAWTRTKKSWSGHRCWRHTKIWASQASDPSETARMPWRGAMTRCTPRSSGKCAVIRATPRTWSLWPCSCPTSVRTTMT